MEKVYQDCFCKGRNSSCCKCDGFGQIEVTVNNNLEQLLENSVDNNQTTYCEYCDVPINKRYIKQHVNMHHRNKESYQRKKKKNKHKNQELEKSKETVTNNNINPNHQIQDKYIVCHRCEKILRQSNISEHLKNNCSNPVEAPISFVSGGLPGSGKKR